MSKSSRITQHSLERVLLGCAYGDTNTSPWLKHVSVLFQTEYKTRAKVSRRVEGHTTTTSKLGPLAAADGQIDPNHLKNWILVLIG